MIWIQFVVCTALLVIAAGTLSRYGDVLAEKVALYLVAMRLVFFFEKRRQVEFEAERAEKLDYAHILASRAYLMFGLAALGMLVLGVWLSSIADQITETTGLASSFVGNLFLAASTSLPEVVVSLAAIRLAALGLAVGNVLGSNLFNIAIIPVYDVAYRSGSL